MAGDEIAWVDWRCFGLEEGVQGATRYDRDIIRGDRKTSPLLVIVGWGGNFQAVLSA